MITFIIPSRGRPKQCLDAITCARQHTVGLCEVILCVDSDDEFMHEYEDMATSSGHVDSFVLMKGRTPPGRSVNLAKPYIKGDVIVPFSDDVFIQTDAWDNSIKFISEQTDYWACQPWDGISWATTMFILSRKYVDALGYIIPNQLEHWYGDTWVGDVAKMAGRLYQLPDVYFEHRHPINGGQMDDTYRHQHRGGGGVIARDNRIYNETFGSRIEDARKIMALAINESEIRYSKQKEVK